jgi:hypothetical protein
MDADRIKEEDLANHLLPEGDSGPQDADDGEGGAAEDSLMEEEDGSGADKGDDAAGRPEDAEKLMRLRDAVYKHSDTDPAAMLLDSQIHRAYELLKGYQIFQGLSRQ